MASDEGGVGAMNLFCPLGGVLIRTRAEIRKEAEFKMVVRIDEARQKQISREVEARGERCSFDFRGSCLIWIECSRARL